jgi:hypothetical protein
MIRVNQSNKIGKVTKWHARFQLTRYFSNTTVRKLKTCNYYTQQTLHFMSPHSTQNIMCALHYTSMIKFNHKGPTLVWCSAVTSRVGSDSIISSQLDTYGACEATVTRSATRTTIPLYLPAATIMHTNQAATMDAVTTIRGAEKKVTVGCSPNTSWLQPGA